MAKARKKIKGQKRNMSNLNKRLSIIKKNEELLKSFYLKETSN